MVSTYPDQNTNHTPSGGRAPPPTFMDTALVVGASAPTVATPTRSPGGGRRVPHQHPTPRRTPAPPAPRQAPPPAHTFAKRAAEHADRPAIRTRQRPCSATTGAAEAKTADPSHQPADPSTDPAATSSPPPGAESDAAHDRRSTSTTGNNTTTTRCSHAARSPSNQRHPRRLNRRRPGTHLRQRAAEHADRPAIGPTETLFGHHRRRRSQNSRPVPPTSRPLHRSRRNVLAAAGRRIRRRDRRDVNNRQQHDHQDPHNQRPRPTGGHTHTPPRRRRPRPEPAHSTTHHRTPTTNDNRTTILQHSFPTLQRPVRNPGTMSRHAVRLPATWARRRDRMVSCQRWTQMRPETRRSRSKTPPRLVYPRTRCGVPPKSQTRRPSLSRPAT